MGFIESVVEKYPKYAIVLLLIYSVLVTGASVVTFFYTNYYEAKKPYLTAVFKYCEDVSDTVGRIPWASQYPTDKVQDFWAYYHGKLVIVEDRNLASKMVDYGRVLRETTPANFSEQKYLLNGPALAVAGACRDLIKATWALSIVPWVDVQKPAQ